MKEFYSEQGGRHIYNSDFKNLQALGLSMSRIFDDCGGNFVISGCEVKNKVVYSGYAFIAGKVRRVDETEIESTANLYIMEDSSNGPSTTYLDGTSHPQYIDYKTTVVQEPVSGKEYVRYDTSLGRFPNLGDVFLNHYALVKDGNAQYVDTIVSFLNSITTTGVKLISGNEAKTCDASIDNDGIVSMVLKDNGVESVTFRFAPNGIVYIYRGETLLWQLDGIRSDINTGGGVDPQTAILASTLVYTPSVQLITTTEAEINGKTDYAVVNVKSPVITLPRNPKEGKYVRIQWRATGVTLVCKDTSKIVWLNSDNISPVSTISTLARETVHTFTGGIWYTTVIK